MAATYTVNSNSSIITAQALDYVIEPDDYLEELFAKLRQPIELVGGISQMSYKDLIREALAAEESFIAQLKIITQVCFAGWLRYFYFLFFI